MLTITAVFLLSTQLLPLQNNIPIQLQDALTECNRVKLAGPITAKLGSVASINVPSGLYFIPTAQAMALQKAIGNTFEGTILGVVTSADFEPMFVLEQIQHGYISDSEADQLHSQASGLLDTIRQNTEKGNQQRTASGMPSLVISGWDEQPEYNKSKRVLNWSIRATEGDIPIINYVQLLLNREGMIRCVAVSNLAASVNVKQTARALVANINMNAGQRYEDFKPGVDKMAEFGLTALITGVIAKKFGLFALIGVILVKGWKIIIVVAMVFFGFLGKAFLGSNPTSNTEQPSNEQRSTDA